MNTIQAPFDWQRGPRSSFSLGIQHGVYALFLRRGAVLPGIETDAEGLLYIGLAANRAGLKGRCHFNARTNNHSPRKSLAALLLDQLQLVPVLITKPNSADTWGLEKSSDHRLSEWMHDALELAIEYCEAPGERETELVGKLNPPLNLTKCFQTQQHQIISQKRSAVFTALKAQTPNHRDGQFSNWDVGSGVLLHSPSAVHQKSDRKSLFTPCQLNGSSIETAEQIAARFGLDAKSYRHRLRQSVTWYCKPQSWAFASESAEWKDMIEVAKSMSDRSPIYQPSNVLKEG